MDLQSLLARFLAVILLLSCVAKIDCASAGAASTRGGACHQAHTPNYLRRLKEVLEHRQITLMDHGRRRMLTYTEAKIVALKDASSESYVLEAKDPLTKEVQTLATISFDKISADGKSIPLNLMFTEPEFRQNNLSNLLFHWFSLKRPQVNRLSLHFASTNLAEFNKFLIGKLRAHRHFDEAAYREAQGNAQHWRFYQQGLVPNYRSEFKACCQNIPLADIRTLVPAAIRATPLFRTVQQKGFTQISDIQFDPNGATEISFAISRD